MIGFLSRFAVFLLIFYLLRVVLSALFGKRKASARASGRSRSFAGTPPAIQGQMVKDPQCGTHVATSIAVTARTDSETLYFCSEECRAEYLKTRG